MVDESKYPTRIAPYGLRMPPDLKERVQAAADASGRSMNAEIVHRLEQSFAPPIELPTGEDALTPAELLRMDRIMRDFTDLLVNRSQKSQRE